MPNTVTINQAFGKYPSGTTFEVIREAKNNYIVKQIGGTKSIVLSKTLTGNAPVAPVVEKVKLTKDQYDHLYKPYVDKGQADLSGYLLVTGSSLELAKDDLDFITSKISSGAEFYHEAAVTPVPSSKNISTSMSQTELEVLKTLLDGDTVDELELSPVTPNEEEEEVEEEPEPEPTLGEDEIWFTDITNGRLPLSGINHRVQVYPKGTWDSKFESDIPEVDEDHFWDTEVLESLITARVCDERCLLTGLPGAGKSSSVKQFSAHIRQPYMRIGGRGDLETASLLGFQQVEVDEKSGKNVTTFKDGMLTQGVKEGYLVTIDEVMKIPSYIQMSMQHLYEKDGHLTVDDRPEDKIVQPPKEFLLILTDNVKGTGDDQDKFGATQVQDSSTLDRVGVNENVPYLPQEEEVKMLTKKFPTAHENTVRQLVKFAGLIRSGYKESEVTLVLSPRGLMTILSMTEDMKLPLERAINLGFINKLAEESEVLAVKDMLRTVGLLPHAA